MSHNIKLRFHIYRILESRSVSGRGPGLPQGRELTRERYASQDEWTPLHMAAFNNQPGSAQDLLDAGADKKARDKVRGRFFFCPHKERVLFVGVAAVGRSACWRGSVNFPLKQM